MWISHRYTCVPSILKPLQPPSPSYSSRLSQSTSFVCPVSYIKLTLVFWFTYDNVCISRERERERKTRGPKPLVEQGCFNDLSVSIYRLLCKEFLSTMIKIRKPDVQQLLSRKQGINSGHNVRRQSISQERGSWLSSFVVRRMFTEGTSVLGAACRHSRYQELISNRGFMRDRKEHTGIFLLNIL